jgi:hypothetical protein
MSVNEFVHTHTHTHTHEKVCYPANDTVDCPSCDVNKEPIDIWYIHIQVSK